MSTRLPLRLLGAALLCGLCSCLAFAQATAQSTSASAPTAGASDPTIVLRPTIPAYFAGCSHEPEGSEAKANCSAGKLISYISRNLNYPLAAREQGIEGVVVLSFVITDHGRVEQVKVLRDIGGGCGEEARRIISEMPHWQPAIHKGDSVYTQFTLPITFGLKTNLFDYVLHTADLDEGEVTRAELQQLVATDTLSVTSPQGKNLLITEVVYTFERGGERQQLITRGREMPDPREFSKFLGRKPGRLSIEANVADGMDIRTVSKLFVVVR